MGFKDVQHSKKYPYIVALAAGLYPLLHYYNSNFDMADSWVQLLFLVSICLLLPLFLVLVSPAVFKLSFLQKFEKYRLAAINISMFCGLLSMLIFLSNRKIIVLVLFVACLISLFVYKQLSKIIILQLLLAVMSCISLVPRLWFMANYNAEWTHIEDDITLASFKKSPNIYVIQPDGYTNFTALREAPYNYHDTKFEDWLTARSFTTYPNFRSNYHSTVTSNSSMFAMKHHYLQNTYRGNLKTFGSQEVIVGDYNNVLKTLKHNNYKTHLITDNSYFIINRKKSLIDYCNIDQSDVKLYDTGGIPEADILPDLEKVLQTASKSNNFYFIEKTIPSHIAYTESSSTGIKNERIEYLQRLETANEWVQGLVDIIEGYDSNALIIIVADHGGYVGLTYTKEIETRQLTALETVSVFSSLLAIKWQNRENPSGIDIETNVNLFRNVFSVLSDDVNLLNNLEEDKSFIPRYEGGNGVFYECINEDYKVVNKKLKE
jgi:hypothetical protein